MTEIQQYKIAHGVYQAETLAKAPYEQRLEAEVNRLIGEGWRPHGNLVAVSHGDTVIFVQPMVRTARTGVSPGVVTQVEAGHYG